MKMEGATERLARLEVMLGEIRQDLQDIRGMISEIRREMRESGERLARLEESQSRQDQEIHRLASRDWVGGILAVALSSAIAALSRFVKGG